MGEPRTGLTWRGIPVETLSREELIIALYNLHDRHRSDQEFMRDCFKLDQEFEQARKALARR